MKRSIRWVAAAAAMLGLGLGLGMAVAAAVTEPGEPGHGPMRGMGAMMGNGPGMMGHGPGMMGHGPGMMERGQMGGPASMLTKQDAGSGADLGIVHELLASNASIRRTVTLLPNGIRTLTESDDPEVAQFIKAHVASMDQRLAEGREFNLFSKSLPVLFARREAIRSSTEVTDKGALVTQTSTDREVVAALQQHAGEVSELARDGMAAMRRGMMSRMAVGDASPGAPAGNRDHRH